MHSNSENARGDRISDNWRSQNRRAISQKWSKWWSEYRNRHSIRWGTKSIFRVFGGSPRPEEIWMDLLKFTEKRRSHFAPLLPIEKGVQSVIAKCIFKLKPQCLGTLRSDLATSLQTNLFRSDFLKFPAHSRYHAVNADEGTANQQGLNWVHTVSAGHAAPGSKA